jgi:hypothetical protein
MDSRIRLTLFEVDIACEDITGDGCTAAMGLASLNLGVYTP